MSNGDIGSGGAQGAGAMIYNAVGTASGTGYVIIEIPPTLHTRQVHTVAVSRTATIRRIGQTA